MTTRLSVNLNKVALLRNQRDGDIPSVPEAGRIALGAGAHGLTVHPRPDHRHIRPGDLAPLRALTRARGRELNVEGYPSADFLALVTEIRPEQVTLVPDAPEARTSDAGWDIPARADFLAGVVRSLGKAGIRVSLFIEPDPAAATAAAATGADRIEIYTGHYATAFRTGQAGAEAAACRRAVLAARAAGIGVNIGHDLDLVNLPPLLRRTGAVDEASIGHALTADALWRGLAGAVTAYLDVLAEGQGPGQD